MKMNKPVHVCMIVAMIATASGVFASSSFGQKASATSGTMDTTNPPVNYYNAAKGYGIAGVIALDYPGGTSAGNIALGYLALDSNTTGFANTAVGYEALVNNATGTYNTAVG